MFVTIIIVWVLPLAFKNVYVGGAIPMVVLHQLILTYYPP
jgi:hypothetical protein